MSSSMCVKTRRPQHAATTNLAFEKFKQSRMIPQRYRERGMLTANSSPKTWQFHFGRKRTTMTPTPTIAKSGTAMLSSLQGRGASTTYSGIKRPVASFHGM